MKKFEKDETFLARWTENKLSANELSEFQSEEEFALFDKINKEVSSFSVPKANLEGDYQKVKTKLSLKGKVISFKRFYYVAASIVILLGLFWFVNSSKTITAEFGEKILAELPDGSKVHLNSGSEISYKRFFWNSNRVVNLDGEAYFDVTKGETGLKVISESGQVDVLGTQFNIVDRKQRFEVICYSGKVSVTKKNTSENYILERGDKVTIYQDQIAASKTIEITPDWMNGISLFKNQPLISVLESLQRQYDVKIDTKNVDTSQIFTGSFVHDDLSSALKTTLPVMGISYQVSKDQKTILLK
jgi:ferric-dicitrate binding protein FerR (iron transport regulator)